MDLYDANTSHDARDVYRAGPVVLVWTSPLGENLGSWQLNAAGNALEIWLRLAEFFEALSLDENLLESGGIKNFRE